MKHTIWFPMAIALGFLIGLIVVVAVHYLTPWDVPPLLGILNGGISLIMGYVVMYVVFGKPRF